MGKKVMVVDDDPVVRATVSALLEARGYEVTERAEGRGTTAALMQDPHDVLVLDVQMPGLSGEGLLRALANNATLGFRLPIVVLHSGMGPVELARIRETSGAAGAIQKGDAREFVRQFEAIVASKAVG